MPSLIERVTVNDHTLEYDADVDAWFEVGAQRRPISARRALRLLAPLGLGLAVAGPASAATVGYGGGSSE